MQKKLIVLYLLASLFSFSYLVYSDHPPDSNITFPRDQIQRDLALIQKIRYYDFDILFLPDDVEVKAGENTTMHITVVNKGGFRLHEFNLSLSGIDYHYEITPKTKEIPVWGDWNPINGQMRGKQDYQINISIPSNATGVHLVNLTGREHFSWRKFSKTNTFILKVIPLVPIEPNITVSKIEVPETIKENEPFDITFSVNSLNIFRQQIDILLNIPSGWSALESKKSLVIEPNETANVNFTITPTNTSGNISVNVVYPFKKQIFSISREGPLLIPEIEKPKEEEVAIVKKPPTGFAALMEFFRNLSPIFLSILVLIIVIVVWFIVKLVRFYTGRKKPEE